MHVRKLKFGGSCFALLFQWEKVEELEIWNSSKKHVHSNA